MSDQEPVFIPTRQLRNRYGGVSHMWVERRLNEDPNFPRPRYLGQRRYWSVVELEEWERKAASNQKKAEEKRLPDAAGGSEPNEVAKGV